MGRVYRRKLDTPFTGGKRRWDIMNDGISAEVKYLPASGGDNRMRRIIFLLCEFLTPQLQAQAISTRKQ
jgi:hypothetical protein